MQFVTIATLLFASFVASSMALPARLAYYQQQPAFYYQTQSSPQRLMYMQYVQQPSVSMTSGRLTNTAAAFVAGDTVATGTYVKDDEQQVAASETVLENTGANSAQSVAEAYPAEYPQDDGLGYEVPQADEYEVPEAPQVALDEEPALEDEVAPENEAVPEISPEPVAAAAAAPAVPAVPEPAVAAAVELEEEVENDDDANNVNDDEDDEEEYVPKPSRRRPVAKATTAAPAPAGSFFSVDFGGATGGAVAISNSFSTGKNGSAKSQAVAFGNPEEARLKSAPSRRRH